MNGLGVDETFDVDSDSRVYQPNSCHPTLAQRKSMHLKKHFSQSLPGVHLVRADGIRLHHIRPTHRSVIRSKLAVPGGWIVAGEETGSMLAVGVQNQDVASCCTVMRNGTQSRCVDSLPSTSD